MIQPLLFLFRRMIFSFLVVFASHMTFLQIQYLLLFQVTILIYLGWFRPMDSRLANNMEIINEVMILLQTYPLLLYTDFVTSATT